MKSYTRDMIDNPSGYRATKPLARQSLTMQSPEVQQRLRIHCQRIKDLSDEVNQTGTLSGETIRTTARALGIRPAEVIESLIHARLYWATYPEHALEQAFTPIVPSSRQSTSKSRHRQKPRKHPHILSIEDNNQREELMAFAKAINELIESRDAHGGRLPPGTLQAIADQFGYTTIWIIEQIEYLQAYRAAYGHEDDYLDANAFVPMPKGRIPGRTLNPRTQDIIEKAFLKTSWESLNEDGTTSKTTKILGPRMIHQLAAEESKDVLSETTTWRVIRDFKKEHPALVQAAHEGVNAVRNLMPAISVKSLGVWERIQLDIRPLAIRVNYQGIECNVRLIIIIDEYSRYIPIAHILPAKKWNSDEEVLGQDYTAQKVRELLAAACLRVNSRPRIIYLDNGTQFNLALETYILLLTATDEPPTQLIHRQVKIPRGGGKVERSLQERNTFATTRSSAFNEKKFRESLPALKKGQIRRFEDLVQSLEIYMENVNTESSRGERPHKDLFMSEPHLGLSLPSIYNLAMFAMTGQQDTRRPKPVGFEFGTKFYVPLQKNPDLYKLLADASARAQNDENYKILVRRYVFQDMEFVFFSFDSVTWYPAIDKANDKLTALQHSEIMKTVERNLVRQGNEADVFIHALLHQRDDPIILNGLHKTAKFEPISEAHANIDAVLARPDRFIMPRVLDEHETMPVQTERKKKPKIPESSKKRPSTDKRPLRDQPLVIQEAPTSTENPPLRNPPSLPNDVTPEGKASRFLSAWEDEELS